MHTNGVCKNCGEGMLASKGIGLNCSSCGKSVARTTTDGDLFRIYFEMTLERYKAIQKRVINYLMQEFVGDWESIYYDETDGDMVITTKETPTQREVISLIDLIEELD